MLTPFTRALAQLDDPVFLGVLWRSVALSLLAFVALLAACAYGAEELLGQPGWLGWLAGIAGGLGAAIAAVWLFVPVAILIATLYSDRIADAVDRRFYPGIPAPRGASIPLQAWDGVVLGAQVLGMQIVALLLTLALPGVGFVLGYIVTGWAIGRGLFVAVAMRRTSRTEALALYARRRWPVLLTGIVLAVVGSVPPLNLLVPILGVAALTHVLNEAAQ